MWRGCLESLVSLFVLISFLPLGTESCVVSEREALLEFKRGLQNYGSRLSSWEGHNCCLWAGVICHNTTGHIISLNLAGWPLEYYFPLSGELSSSLLQLSQLTHLDLSYNMFPMKIPKFIGSFHHLKYLILSNSDFRGQVPHELGNLTSMIYLDLSYNFELYSDNLHWLSHLSLLMHLDISYVNLNRSHDWLHSVNMLNHLSVLYLSNCSISSILPSLLSNNLSSLVTLDLSSNSINSSFPAWLCNLTALTNVDFSNNDINEIPDCLGSMASLASLDWKRNNLGHQNRLPETIMSLCNLQMLCLSGNHLKGSPIGFLKNSTGCLVKSLKDLDLSDNELNGTLPASFCKFLLLRQLKLSNNLFSNPVPECLKQLQQLATLSLSHNSLNGSFPATFCQLYSLEELHLDSNKLGGPFPKCLGQLSKLAFLTLSFNSFSGVVTEAHFTNLSGLKRLDMTSNDLSFHVPSGWVPLFNLDIILLGSCKLGPDFPAWLRTQNFTQLDISNSGIRGTVPNWLWKISPQLRFLNISHNQITGKIPSEAKFSSIDALDMSSNNLEGPLPQLGHNTFILDLSNNSFSGYLSSFLNNSSASSPFHVGMIKLSNNKLKGKLPSCWDRLQGIRVIDLRNNSLTGEIPKSMGSLQSLGFLSLDSNQLSGFLPPSFKNLTELKVLDLSNNKLRGKIPSWIRESLYNLVILRLNGNMFDGEMPAKLALLGRLRVLDISHNNLSGQIPTKWGEFPAMIFDKNETLSDYFGYVYLNNPEIKHDDLYSLNLPLIIKGRVLDYSGGPLRFLTGIDVSNNGLFGEIPEEICNLKLLYSLNLSGNHLIGRIPKNIGKLQKLESLDLSGNRLSCSIPSSISLLYSLSYLNLSYNNLSGEIPKGNQLRTLEQLSPYVGNPYLCGSPLPKHCPTRSAPKSPRAVSKDEGRFLWIWVYSGMAPGFAAGFWGLMLVLVFKKNWRIAYFCFFDKVFG